MKLGSQYYRTNLEDEDKANEIFERFVRETNAVKYVASPAMDYIVTEDETPEVYELRRTENSISAVKAMILEDTVVEGSIEEEKVEEISEWYEELE